MLKPSAHTVFCRCEDFKEEYWGRRATVERWPTPGRRGAGQGDVGGQRREEGEDERGGWVREEGENSPRRVGPQKEEERLTSGSHPCWLVQRRNTKEDGCGED
jgi:hypothetical protein